MTSAILDDTKLMTAGYVLALDALESSVWDDAMSSVEALFDRAAGPLERWIPEGSPFDVGFMPYGRARAGDTGVPNLLEAWTLHLDSSLGLPSDLAAHWEAVARLGRSLRDLEGQLRTYYSQVTGVSSKLLGSATATMETLLCLHYPADLARVKEGRRQSVHTDPSVISLLPRASPAGGLIVIDGGRSDVVQYGTGDVLVMTGTALSTITGGQLPACVHTVEIEDPPSDRYAVVAFSSPAPDAELSSTGLSGRDLHHDYFEGRFSW